MRVGRNATIIRCSKIPRVNGNLTSPLSVVRRRCFLFFFSSHRTVCSYYSKEKKKTYTIRKYCFDYAHVLQHTKVVFNHLLPKNIANRPVYRTGRCIRKPFHVERFKNAVELTETRRGGIQSGTFQNIRTSTLAARNR